VLRGSCGNRLKADDVRAMAERDAPQQPSYLSVPSVRDNGTFLAQFTVKVQTELL
jgi:hypothetical protein